jgi:RES domain-containing protein
MRKRWRLLDPADIVVVHPDAVPNPNWLRPGTPSAGQQACGARLLAARRFVLIPSTVSTHRWNLIFDSARTAGAYAQLAQEQFVLDTRLHPPAGKQGQGRAARQALA